MVISELISPFCSQISEHRSPGNMEAPRLQLSACTRRTFEHFRVIFADPFIYLVY